MKTALIALSALAITTAAPALVDAGDKNKSKDKAKTEMKTTDMTVVEIAAGNEDFSTLVAAVKAAGLVETLSGEGPFTVFAPTNEAFAKLPEGTIETLLKPENKEMLIGILTYHVVAGEVMAKDVMKVESAKSVQGGDIAVTVKKGTVMIDNATVVMADIKAKNGVIHVIDTVILPQEEEAE